jgi:purine-nucleoside phosphorylase
MEKLPKLPKTMIILGSGLNSFVNLLEDKTTESYEELYDFETDTSIGHSGYRHIGSIDGIDVVVFEGRKHYYEDVSNKDIRLMIEDAIELGVESLIVTNACGGMNEKFKPGDIMVIDDHINMMGKNPLVGPNNNLLGPRFVDMSDPYNMEYRVLIDKIADQKGIKLQHGVYVGYLGPSYETKAEIRAFKMLGGDAVGMSTIPEVIVAKHAGLRVLGLSVITNMATGISKTPLSHKEVLKIGGKAALKVNDLLTEFIKHI